MTYDNEDWSDNQKGDRKGGGQWGGGGGGWGGGGGGWRGGGGGGWGGGGGGWGGGQWGGGQWGGGQWGGGQWGGGNPYNRQAQQGDCTVRVGRVTAVTPGSVPNMRNVSLYFGRPFGPNLAEFTLTYQNVGSGWPIFESQVNTLWECWVRYTGAPGSYTMELCQDRPPKAIGACPMAGYEPLCQGIGPVAAAAATPAPSACYNHYGMVTAMKELGPAGREVTVALGGGHIGTVEKTFVVKPWDGVPGTEDPLYKAPLYSMWNVPFDSAGNRCGPAPSILFEKCGREGVVGEWYPLCTLDPRVSKKCTGPYFAIVTANQGGKVQFKVNVDKKVVEKTLQVPADHWVAKVAKPNFLFKVHLQKDGAVCLDPAPALLDRCKTPTDPDTICKEDTELGRGCKAYPAMVLAKTPGKTGTAVKLVTFTNNNKTRVVFEYPAKPGEDIADAPLYSVYSVWLDKQNKVCVAPEMVPTKMKDRCGSANDYKPLCNEDPRIRAGCKKVLGIVKGVKDLNDKEKRRAVTLVVTTPQKKRLEVTYTAIPADKIYDASEWSLWDVFLDNKNAVCGDMPPEFRWKECKTVGDPAALCKEVPKFSCVAEKGQVKAAGAITTNKAGVKVRTVTMQFNPGGKGVIERTFVADADHPLHYARPKELWTVYLEKAGQRNICPLPKPGKTADNCAPNDTSPICKVRCDKAVAVPGVVVDVAKLANGGCAITVAYVQNDTKKNVVTGRAELPKGTNCDAFKQNQGVTVLRSAADGSFCGLQQPVSPTNNFCTKPFTPANQEVCTYACTKFPCASPGGCSSGQKTGTQAVAIEAPTIAGEEYVLTFMYMKGEGPSVGTLRTADTSARLIKKGQAYTVYKDLKTDTLCELGPVSPLVDFCNSDSPEAKMLCKAACQYVPGLCIGGTPTPGPGGSGGSGLDLQNLDLKVRLANQNQGSNANGAGGGVPGGPYFGPGGLLYPGGNGFILPPEKVVVPVPSVTETHVLGAYPAPPPDDLLGDGGFRGEGPHGGRRWNADDPPVPNPTATPAATFVEGEGEEVELDPLPEEELAMLPGGDGTGAPALAGAPPAVSTMLPPAAPPPGTPRWVWIVVALVVALVVGGLWWWFRHKAAASNSNSEAVIFM